MSKSDDRLLLLAVVLAIAAFFGVLWMSYLPTHTIEMMALLSQVILFWFGFLFGAYGAYQSIAIGEIWFRVRMNFRQIRSARRREEPGRFWALLVPAIVLDLIFLAAALAKTYEICSSYLS